MYPRFQVPSFGLTWSFQSRNKRFPAFIAYLRESKPWYFQSLWQQSMSPKLLWETPRLFFGRDFVFPAKKLLGLAAGPQHRVPCAEKDPPRVEGGQGIRLPWGLGGWVAAPGLLPSGNGRTGTAMQPCPRGQGSPSTVGGDVSCFPVTEVLENYLH